MVVEGVFKMIEGKFEIIEPNGVKQTAIPNEKIVERPWGFYRMFAENVQCTAKVLYIRSNEMLSLQFHRIRDQVYYIIDPMTVYLSDSIIPNHLRNSLPMLREFAESHLIKYECKPGTFIKIPRFTLHRPMYLGEKEHGLLLDIAFNKNDEADIIRIEDKYERVVKDG